LIIGLLLFFGASFLRPHCLPSPLLDPDGNIVRDEKGKVCFDENSQKEVARPTAPYDLVGVFGVLLAATGLILVLFSIISSQKQQGNWQF